MTILASEGKIKFLRVHEVGSGWGAPQDNLNDAEVIVRIENDPNSYGFGLRNDDRLPAAQAMFALLEDAFNAKVPVCIEYEQRPGMTNHYLLRVIRTA